MKTDQIVYSRAYQNTSATHIKLAKMLDFV